MLFFFLLYFLLLSSSSSSFIFFFSFFSPFLFLFFFFFISPPSSLCLYSSLLSKKDKLGFWLKKQFLILSSWLLQKSSVNMGCYSAKSNLQLPCYKLLMLSVIGKYLGRSSLQEFAQMIMEVQKAQNMASSRETTRKTSLISKY